MNITEEELKKYGIISIVLISESRLIVKHLDDSQYLYDVIDIKNIDNIIKQHINKYCLRIIRKEKLEKISNL